MKLELSELVPYVVAALTAAAGWGWREVQRLTKAHTDLETEVAKTYVTKADNEKALDRIYAALERIEAKVDRH